MKSKFSDILLGNYIKLRKVVIEDALDIYDWRTGNAGKFLHHPIGYNVEMQKKWIINRPDNEINYIIINKLTNEKVGMISICECNFTDKVAEVGRLLLKDYYLNKSNPFGLEALLICYDYVLNKMKFRKITGTIASLNSNMLKLQLFLGMKQEGLLSKHTFINNQYTDIHILSIFSDQFNQDYFKKINFLLKPFINDSIS